MNESFFRREKVLYGKYVKYVKELKDKGIFGRYIDIYKVVFIVGFLYNKKEEEDKVKNFLGILDEVKIFIE